MIMEPRNQKNRRKTWKGFAGIALLAACLGTFGPAQAETSPAVITLPNDFYPESVTVAEDGTFYVSSWHQGAVARVLPGQDKAEIFIPSGSNGLFNGQGVLVDAARQTLWVCSGSVGFSIAPRTESALKAFDLTTGTPKASYALPGGGYCNDMALSRAGRIYVADSQRPRILVLDDEKSALRTWVENPALCRVADNCLNGIAIDRDQAVYVSHISAAPELLKIAMTADGSAGEITPIRVPRLLKNVDAVRLLDAEHLVIFESNAFAKNDPLNGSVSLVTLHPGRSASVDTLANGLAAPSSGVVHGGRVFFIQSKWEVLFRHAPDAADQVEKGVPFVINSLELPVQP